MSRLSGSGSQGSRLGVSELQGRQIEAELAMDGDAGRLDADLTTVRAVAAIALVRVQQEGVATTPDVALGAGAIAEVEPTRLEIV